MKALVLGSENGFLAAAFKKSGFDLFGRKDGFDMRFPLKDSLLSKKIFLGQYDTLINCIGNSDTRYCEENFNEALRINGNAVGELSRLCDELAIKFVHISTGCVYNEYGIPQMEDDLTVAQCNYVSSKILGESLCRPDDIILRPRLLYGDKKSFDKDGNEKRNNLLVKMLKFDKFTRELNSFTNIQDIVDCIEPLVKANQRGVFNIASEGYASMSELANWCGIEHTYIGMDELRKSNNINLVNSVMSLDKIRHFYQPRELKSDIKSCMKKLIQSDCKERGLPNLTCIEK